MSDDRRTAVDHHVPASRRDRVLTAIGQGSPVSGALVRYRVMAYTVGVGLVVLVFIGMPLQFGAGSKTVVAIVGPIHGALYIVYLLAALDLVRRTRLPVWSMLAMVAAGLVPFVAFIVERRVTARLGGARSGTDVA